MMHVEGGVLIRFPKDWFLPRRRMQCMLAPATALLPKPWPVGEPCVPAAQHAIAGSRTCHAMSKLLIVHSTAACNAIQWHNTLLNIPALSFLLESSPPCSQ